jgi:hypothetical protein
MITKIDEKYDVILTFSPINEITGHIFECFDYYLFLREYYKVGILFLGSIKEEKLKNVFNDKYIVNYDDVKCDFVIIPAEKLKYNKMITFGKNTVVILCDGNIHQLQLYGIHLITRKLLGFLCAEKEESYVDKISMYKHIIYLKDYRIYSNNNFFKSYNYVKKLPFKWYKKSNKVYDNTGMMYVTYACRKISPEIIKEYHTMSNCNKTLLVVPFKLQEYDDIDNVIQMEAPMDDFFNSFDTYIYTPVQRKFDCSPRLVTECFLHNKKVVMNLDYVDLGLQTRYNDCVENLESLNLKENDDILQIIEEVRHGKTRN